MKILKKQLNSRMCLICGVNNEAGLKASFYEMEDQSVVSFFTYREIHQSYPGRCHGGMITCTLDELIGRAIWILEPEVWGVTTDINVKFLKPVPLNEELMGVGRITKNNRFLFEAEGFIKDRNGTILATAKGVYFKLKPEQISEVDMHEEMFLIPDNVTELKLY